MLEIELNYVIVTMLSNFALPCLSTGTSASMYSMYGAAAVQPGVRVVHTGTSKMVLQPQKQMVVLPSMAPQTIIQHAAAQPAVMIQPAAPAVRVIQPTAPAVQVIQPTAPAARIIQPQVLPTIIQPAANTKGE